jgi:murein DD-endopeptidase MepM/ murein hydrolase activator NlpD
MQLKFLILFIFIIFLPLGLIAVAQSDNDVLLEQIRAKEEEIKRLEVELNKYKDVLSQKQSQSKTLNGQIALLEAQITKLKGDLKITQARISKTESNIRLYSKKITDKEKKIAERQAAISKSVRFLAYADDLGFFSAFLQSRKLSDFLSLSEYIINLEGGLYANLKALSEDKKDLEGLLSGQKELKGELTDLKQELQAKDRLIQNQKDEKNTLLKETKNQEAEYQKMISKIQIRQAEIQKEIFGLEDKLRGEVGGVPRPRPGALGWPLVGRLTQGYGPTSITGFYNDAYKFHNGIDIAVEYGAPIRASLEGVISASGDNGRYAYGKWLAIRHDNGLMTLYAHLSSKVASVGQNVRQGQIIGYEGSTGFVTGPHLHFTVYSTNTFRTENRWFGLLPLGGSVNPFDYLLK